MRCAHKVYRIKPVLIEQGATKVVENISQQAHICSKVEIYVVLEHDASILSPDELSVSVVLLGTFTKTKPVVESLASR